MSLHQQPQDMKALRTPANVLALATIQRVRRVRQGMRGDCAITRTARQNDISSTMGGERPPICTIVRIAMPPMPARHRGGSYSSHVHIYKQKRQRKYSKLGVYVALAVPCIIFISFLPFFPRGKEILQRVWSRYAHHADQPDSGSLHVSTWECMRPGSCTKRQLYGNSSFSCGPSRGFFPHGCRWRDVIFEGDRGPTYEYYNSATDQWSTQQPAACVLQVYSDSQSALWSVHCSTRWHVLCSLRRVLHRHLSNVVHMGVMQPAFIACLVAYGRSHVVQTESVPAKYVWNKSTDKRVSLGTPATAVEPKGTYVLMKNLWYNNGRRASSCFLLTVVPTKLVILNWCAEPDFIRFGAGVCAQGWHDPNVPCLLNWTCRSSDRGHLTSHPSRA